MADSKHDQKTTREAERDVETARANLAGSIDSLEARLSPNALVDQGIAYFRGDGRRHLDNLVRNAQANPIPLVLIGIGVAWLAMGSNRNPRPTSAGQRVPTDRYDDALVYGNDHDEYGSASDLNATRSAPGVGASATASSAMAGQPRTTGLGTNTPSSMSDEARDPLRSPDATDPAITGDPLPSDSTAKEPVVASKPTTADRDENTDTLSEKARDPLRSSEPLKNADSSSSDDPLLKDDGVEDPALGSKPTTKMNPKVDKESPSFRDPITNAHSDLDDDKKV
ncbi:DUF3618 domain-containing protein [uncultured Jannaschia sp.]|uniref:DUF3618 domain-containing protein n=1 Tax=uncultured Jannaschia sp. TaxID=293347 RepID=UPI00262F673F|nr:DUF3618 domain-containing protein [uncultured Jannaschia sp.]